MFAGNVCVALRSLELAKSFSQEPSERKSSSSASNLYLVKSPHRTVRFNSVCDDLQGVGELVRLADLLSVSLWEWTAKVSPFKQHFQGLLKTSAARSELRRKRCMALLTSKPSTSHLSLAAPLGLHFRSLLEEGRGSIAHKLGALER